MKIRHRIYISSVISILLMSLLFIILFLSYRQISHELSHTLTANSLVRNTTFLVMITNSYISEPHPRSEQQWHLQYTKLHDMVRQEMDSTHFSGIRDELEFLQDLFTQLQKEIKQMETILSHGKNQVDQKKTQMVINMLSGQIQIVSQKITDRVFAISRQQSISIKNIEKRNFFFVMAFTLGILIVFIFNGYLTISRVSIRLQTLMSAVKSYRKGGSPEKPVSMPCLKDHSDEIDELFTAFGDMTGKMNRFITDLHDEIRIRMETEESLKKSLSEKNVLLKEIHHRVKNNMQIISSLISLQAHYINEPSYSRLLEESHTRINSMALVHEMLYQSDNVSKINLGIFIRNLVDYIDRYLGGASGKITLSIYGSDIFMDINSAIPCALILNELVTNTYKHAFAGISEIPEGAINISMEKTEAGPVRLVYRDNGKGLPDTAVLKKSKTLGMQLVISLVKQLNASLEAKNDNGACFILEFHPESTNGDTE